MKVAFFHIHIPSYLSTNAYDCPISYFMRKYGFEKHLPIPVPLKFGSGEYTVCLSQNMATEFCDILKSEEDCQVTLLQKNEYGIDNFKDMFVHELSTLKNGIRGLDRFLTKRIY
jgi:hypothetical protein